MLKLRERKVEIVNLSGRRLASIDALCVGRLALHEYTDIHGSGWRISHIPTGGCVLTINGDKEKAVGVMEKIIASPVDWNFRSMESPKMQVAKDVLLPTLRKLASAKLINGEFKKPDTSDHK